VSYRWEFGEGTVLEAATVNHAYTTPGVYPVTLVVGAEDGLGSSATGQIVVTEAQPPEATLPPEPTPGDGTSTALAGPVWRWSELIVDGTPTLVPSPGDYTLSFAPELTFTLKAGCITGSGAYAVDGERIRIDVGGITSEGCEPEPLSDQFLALLGMVGEFELDEGLLLLYPVEEADRMVFVP
jgi:heat shock protein HslJ